MAAGRRLFQRLPDLIGRPQTRTLYIAQVDGLRFLAILQVVVWHASLRAARYIDERNHLAPGSHPALINLYRWFPHGEIGVCLFFFISGFIIAQPFLSRPSSEWDIRQFYWRRLRRIYPPYAAALILSFALVLLSGYAAEDGSPKPMASLLTGIVYLNGIIFNRPSSLNPPLWSLEVEAQFYLVAPLLLAFYFKLRHLQTRLAGALVMICVLTLICGALGDRTDFDPRFRFGLLAHGYLFLAGVVGADLYRVLRLDKRATSRLFDAVFAAGLIGCWALGVGLTSVDARPGGGWRLAVTDLLILAVTTATFIGAMLGPVARQFTGHPWVRLFGAMCFSVYLVHILIVQATASLVLGRLTLTSTPLIYGVYLIVLTLLSFGFGTVFYVFVERPFMTHAARSSRSQAADRRQEATAGDETRSATIRAADPLPDVGPTHRSLE